LVPGGGKSGDIYPESKMSESTRVLILVILVLLLLMALSFLLSRVLMKRAILKLIKMFRDKQAIDSGGAKTQEEIGIKRRSLLEFRALRDYTPMAFQLLVRNNIIQATEEGKFFLSEDALALTNLNVPKSNPVK
jgi:hypothetical protein